MDRKIVQRADKVAFMEVENVFVRMKGFRSLDKNKTTKEFSRQYVDESFETTDTVGMSESISYGFDQYTNDKVHDKMVTITDKELLGSDATVTIVTVDFTKELGAGTYEAKSRTYAVIPGAEGSGFEAYQYTGTFKNNGPNIEGKATSTDDWLTCTFTANAAAASGGGKAATGGSK
ncbi:MAG: hypothetical protein Q4Q17_01125 [Tissierellia bacterium]|nr:hypothetical protein [Tissierellia bacterium]